MVELIFKESTGFAPRPEKPTFAEGTIRIRHIPEQWSEEEYRYWWLPVTDHTGHILKPARLSEQQKAQFELLGKYENLITNAGRSQVLTYIGSSTGSTTQWSQYFAVGTGTIAGVSPSDNVVVNEVFRKAQTSFSVSGTQVDVNFQFGTTDGQFTYTNAGLFGNGATATLGSGTLVTHALFSFTKGAFAIAIDYIVNLL